MKFLLVLLVVGVVLWLMGARLRGPGAGVPRRRKPAAAEPVQMVQCAHCGLHLPAADALSEGSRLYCSDAHRRLGPAPNPPQ
jgi:uncharacterized protein